MCLYECHYTCLYDARHQEFRRARELQGQHGLVSGVMTIDADVLLLQSPRLLMDPLWTLQPTRDTSGVTMPIDGVILIPGTHTVEWGGLGRSVLGDAQCYAFGCVIVCFWVCSVYARLAFSCFWMCGDDRLVCILTPPYVVVIFLSVV